MLKSLATGLTKAAVKSKSSEAKDIGKKLLRKGKEAVSATGESMSKIKSKVMERGSKIANSAEKSRKIVDDMVVFQTFNPIVWILLFNIFLRVLLYFSSNVGKRSQNKLKKHEYTRKHVKETFGVALVSIVALWFITFKFDPDRVSPSYLRDGLFLSLYLTVFMYDYVKNFTKLINKKHFAQTKKSQAKLGGIYFGMALGLLAFFGILIVALYFLQVNVFPSHYNMFGEEFDNFAPLVVTLVIFFMTTVVSIVNFFIVNPELKKSKRRYRDDMKQYYVDSFKLFYIVYIVMFIIIALAINLNVERVSGFLGKFF